MKREILENQAVANTTMSASFKDAVNIGKLIRGKNVNKAIVRIEKIISKELALPCIRFNSNIAHKKGLGIGGRYPKNSSMGVIKALKLLKANAKAKGLDDSKLIVNEFIANFAVSKNKRAKYKSGTSTHLKIGAVVKND
jgi:ribosomal protein L22